MKMTKLLLVMWVAVGAVSCRRTMTVFGPTSFTPTYVEVDNPAPAAPQCAAISGVAVVDPRKEPMSVGYRFHEENPAEKFVISASTDPAKWVESALIRVMKGATMPADTAGKGKVVATIATLDVQEKTAFNSTYNSKLVLDVTLTQPGGDEACWSGRVEGLAENYGAAGKPENYAETMNHALERAAKALLADKGFVDATCGTCAAK